MSVALASAQSEDAASIFERWWEDSITITNSMIDNCEDEAARTPVAERPMTYMARSTAPTMKGQRV